MNKLVWLCCLLLLSGCSWLGSSDDEASTEPADLVDFEPEIRIQKQWSAGIGKGQKRRFARLKPVLADGLIYAADGVGNVFAIDAASGRRKWQVELELPLSGGVGYGTGLVLLGDTEGRVIALNASDGSERWRQQVSSEVLAPPGANASLVAVQTLDGILAALDTETGALLWQHDVDLPSLTLRGTSAPLVTDTMVIAGFANGKILVLNALSGSLLWESRVAVPKGTTELERMVDIEGDPLLVGDVIYITSYQGRMAAMSRGTGRELWYQDVSSYRTPANGLDQVYVTAADDSIKALRAHGGQVVWTNEQMTYRKLTGPAVAGGFLCVADEEGYLHVLSQVDGHLVGRMKVDGSGVSVAMIADGENLYVLDNDGDLRAFSFEPR